MNKQSKFSSEVYERVVWEQIALKVNKEAFRHCVVIIIGNCPHGRSNLHFSTALAKGIVSGLFSGASKLDRVAF